MIDFNNLPLIIAGPCVLERRDRAMEIARHINHVGKRLGVQIIFKASFDKANRSSGKSPRGLGWGSEAKAIFKAVRNLMPVTTDIHESWQAHIVASHVDMLQIPALLCRQTDLLIAAAKTGLPINVKKGQFMAPWDMDNVVTKLHNANCKQLLLTERGSSFGYNNVVVDMRSLGHLRRYALTIFDASHTVQLPGLHHDKSGGERQFIIPMARAAAAFGCDGIFVETHQDPDNAISDGQSSLHLEMFERLINEIMSVRRALSDFNRQ